MVPKLKNKKNKLEDPLEEVVQETHSEDGSDQYHIQTTDIGFDSPQKESPVKLTFEVTGSLSGSMKVCNTHTTTNLGDTSTIFIPE